MSETYDALRKLTPELRRALMKSMWARINGMVPDDELTHVWGSMLADLAEIDREERRLFGDLGGTLPPTPPVPSFVLHMPDPAGLDERDLVGAITMCAAHVDALDGLSDLPSGAVFVREAMGSLRRVLMAETELRGTTTDVDAELRAITGD
ncbi:MAG: hypothetical protein AB7L13_23905 [Acidimicrobiia bacterium]